MRRIIILLIFIAACVYAYKYFNSNVIDYSMEEMVPQGTMMYLKVKDAEKFFTDISKNPVWEALKNIDYKKIDEATNLSLTKTFWVTLLNMDLTKDQKINFLVRRFFSKEVAIAIYPPEENIESTKVLKTYVKDTLEQLMSSLVVISRIPLDVKLADIVSQVFNKYDKKLPTEIVPYKEYTYRTVLLPDLQMKLSFVRLNDFVIVGIGEKSIQKSIDVFINKDNMLSKDKGFIEISERHSRKSDMMGYFNASNFSSVIENRVMNILDLIKKESGETSASEEEQGNGSYLEALRNQVSENFSKIKGFKSIGLSVNVSQLTSVFFTLFFDKDAMDKNYHDFYSCHAAENESIYFVPKDVLSYHWDNCFDPKNALSDFKDYLLKFAGNKSAANNTKTIDALLNASIENQIIPALGGEIGNYLQDIKTDKGFPMPNILFFVSIKDKEKIDNFLNSLEGQSGFSFSKENFKDIELKYLNTPFGEFLQPAYCFLNKYLLIAPNVKLLKSSIAANFDKETSLLDNESFKNINLGLTGKNRKIQYIKMDDLTDKIIFTVEWGNRLMMANEKTKESFEDGMRKRLSDVNSQIYMNEQEIASSQNRINTLEDELIKEQSDEIVKSREDEIDFLKGEISKRKNTLTALKEQSDELQKYIDGYNKGRGLDSKGRRMVIDEVIKPVLTSLKSINAIGIKASSAEDFYETSIYIKSNK